MVRLPEGVRRDPEDAVFSLCFAASIVLGVLGLWGAAGVAFALGIGGAVVVDAFWPDGFETTNSGRTEATADDESETDALDTLRDRYARGDLNDEEFEAKLEALLETETLEDAHRRIERDRENGPSGGDHLGDERSGDDGATERVRE